MPVVRCACGLRHTVPWRAVGKSIRCRCGRQTRVTGPGDVLAVACAAFAVAMAALLFLLSDRWTPATMLAFGPRWVLLVPLLAAAPVVGRIAPRRLWLVGASALLVAGPVMGWSFGLARAFAPSDGPGVRVLTWNVDGGAASAPALGGLLARWAPDVAVFEECGLPFREALQRLPGATLRMAGGICVLSRLPVERTDSMDRRDFDVTLQSGLGGAANVLRVRVTAGGTPLDVVGVHLETPRKGLARALEGDFSGMQGNAIVRELESARARRYVASGDAPAIVAGDFNLPQESTIFRAHWGDLRDAWRDAGFGYGYTKRDVPKIRARIDHVLSDGGWRAWRAQVGDEGGSDHLPLIVDLRRVP